MGFASGLPCVPDMLKNRSRTKGKRAQGTIKNHRSGSAARQGGAPALPTSAFVSHVNKKQMCTKMATIIRKVLSLHIT